MGFVVLNILCAYFNFLIFLKQITEKKINLYLKIKNLIDL